ncbi:MAG: low molecular weight protein-tyrosine-phosphatase [Cytophagaceae bacterium]
MVKVLFVCLGNICRSTMAEGIFRQMIKEEGLDSSISCDSAGTGAYHIGEDPDHRTMQTLRKHGADLIHKGRQFNNQDFEAFDYILAMDTNNFYDINDLARMHDKPNDHVSLMRDFDPLKGNKDVPDPYWSKLDGFEEVYQILLRSNTELLRFLRQKHKI